MDKLEAAGILMDAVQSEMVFSLSDSNRLARLLVKGLEEIARRRQEDGPEAVEMMGGVIRDVVLCPGNLG